MFAGGKKWIAAKIKKLLGNVSYEVTLDDGRKFTRHIDHIRKRYDTQTVGNAMSTTDTSSDLTTDTRSDLTTDTRSDPTTDTRSDLTSDTRSDPTTDTRSDNKSYFRSVN